MESLRTVFRLAVMLAAIGIGYQAWQHFGPPAEQLKEFAVRALDSARSALASPDADDGGSAALAADPRPMAPAIAAPIPTTVPEASGQVMQAQALEPVGQASVVDPVAAPALAPAPTPIPARNRPVDVAVGGGSVSVENEESVGNEDPMKSLYARLKQLGARRPQLSPWGSGGQLYRFSCQMSIAGVEDFNRHFDAIAAEPQVAVEEVIAKVEAWRNGQQETARLDTSLR
jgi:hypothetical protein